MKNGAHTSKSLTKEMKRNKRIIVGFLIVLTLSMLFLSSFYTVSETESAVITRFGRHVATEGAGPHLKLSVADEVEKVSTVNQSMEVGYIPDTNESIKDDSQMITGDMNLVIADFFVTWRVSEPYKFLYNSSEPLEIFRNVVQAAARTVIGNSGIDPVLTSGKLQIQSAIKDIVIVELERYDIGITLVDLILQDAEPADNDTGDVNKAFKEVETAKQEQESKENEGQTYVNEVIPKANAEADKIKKDAEAYKAVRIAQATGEVAEFTEMYKEYSKNPQIVEKRMYLEMIERVFPGIKLYIDSSEAGDMLKILQLNQEENIPTQN